MPLNDKQQLQFNLVCARIADGMSLKAACDFSDVPRRQTILDWLNKDVGQSLVGGGTLSTIYARAREVMADKLADEVMDIAKDPDISTEDKRIQIDACKWIAAKQRPRVYGDKLAIGGADDLPAIRQEVQERADAFTKAIAGMAARGKADKGDTKH